MNISLKIQEEDNNSLTEIVSHLTNLTDPHHSRSTSSPMSLTLSSLLPDTKGRGSYFYYQVLVCFTPVTRATTRTRTRTTPTKYLNCH